MTGKERKGREIKQKYKGQNAKIKSDKNKI
jgi:hypothetical protein